MKKFFVILFIAIIAAAVGVLGFYFGKQQGTKEGKQEVQTKVVEKLQSLVELAFPKPPDDIRSFSGTIKGIYGATINLEISDPDDYLPHTDGSPRAKEIRFASLFSSTKIYLIDTTKLDAQGNPQRTELKLSDLKIGDAVTVRSNQNIRNAKKFDVTKIELVKY